MGIFMQQTLARWWSTREKVQVVIGQGNNMAVLISTYIAGDDDEAKLLRSDLVRYINLAHALLYLQAGSEENYDYFTERGLITAEEKEILQSTTFAQKFLLVYHWAAQLLIRAGATGRVTFPCNMLPTLQLGLSTLRGNAADVFMFLNTQIPYSYTHILAIIIKFHLFMVIIVAGSTMGQGIISGSNSLVCWGYALMVVNTVVFEGLLTMHSKLYNPFGDDPDDVRSQGGDPQPFSSAAARAFFRRGRARRCIPPPPPCRPFLTFPGLPSDQFPTRMYLDGSLLATSSVLKASADAVLPSAVKDRVLSAVPFTCCQVIHRVIFCACRGERGSKACLTCCIPMHALPHACHLELPTFRTTRSTLHQPEMPLHA